MLPSFILLFCGYWMCVGGMPQAPRMSRPNHFIPKAKKAGRSARGKVRLRQITTSPLKHSDTDALWFGDNVTKVPKTFVAHPAFLFHSR